VHLGWRYVTDGYVSLLATPIIWKLSGRLAQASLAAWGRLSPLAPQASGAIA